MTRRWLATLAVGSFVVGIAGFGQAAEARGIRFRTHHVPIVHSHSRSSSADEAEQKNPWAMTPDQQAAKTAATASAAQAEPARSPHSQMPMLVIALIVALGGGTIMIRALRS